MGWTKLHGSIIHSSIWQASKETRLVWVTMLAMADATGMVAASVGGLAHAANVTRKECEAALADLLGPDPDSRDGTTGERITKVKGGWHVINHANYRERQTHEQALAAARVARYRDRQKAKDHDVTCNDVTERNVMGREPSASASVSSSASVPPRNSAHPSDAMDGGMDACNTPLSEQEVGCTSTPVQRNGTGTRPAGAVAAEVAAAAGRAGKKP